MSIGTVEIMRKPAGTQNERLWTVDEIALRWHRSTRYVQEHFKGRGDVLKQGEQRVRLLVPQSTLEMVEQELKTA